MAHGQLTSEELQGSRWVTVPCWHNCGGRCVNKALVKDGKILRQKSDDSHPDSYDHPQARGCLMGRALSQQVLGEDRLRYPMRRAHWEPLTGGDKQLRGRDEWVRISWDEAISAIAGELRHAIDNYGNRSILYMNMINLEGYLGGVLAALGGYTDTAGTQSFGSFAFNPAAYGFQLRIGGQGKTVNDRYDHKNSDYMVLHGFNAAWCAMGQPPYYLKHAKEAGVKFAYIGPDYPVTAGFLNAEWIPVRPGTDTAFMLGVAYSMLTRDEKESLIDWDYLHRCTLGFDAQHMPEGAEGEESFEEYLRGTRDGQPKTQEWASAISGTPVELIDRYADILGRKNNVSIHSNAAPARAKGSENYPQLLMTLAAMGGHFGKPGNACCNDQYYSAFNSGPKLTLMAPGGPSYQMSNCAAIGNMVDDVISTEEIWTAVLDGTYWYAGSSMTGQFKPGEERSIDIHVIVSEQHNFLQSQSGTNKGIEAFRKVDFVCSQAYTLKADAAYADIVLPVSTRWEGLQPNAYNIMCDREQAFACRQKAIDPVGESKTDYEIARLLSESLGVGERFEQAVPFDPKQSWFNQLAMAVMVEPDGSKVPIAEITQEDIDRYGVQGAPHPGKIPLEKWLDDGVYRIRRSEGDPYYFVSYREFREDPESHPLASGSGKMEIHCQAKSAFFDAINGYADGGQGGHHFVRTSPLPKYIPHPESYQDALEGDFPFQMTHMHYPRRAHTDLDNLPWLREAMSNPVFVNVEDARRKGIENGDVIRVFNRNGAFLRPASVIPTVMPGVIMVPHGAGVRKDEETGLDLGGSDNILTTPDNTTTPFLNAWNSTLVNYEKYEGLVSLERDCAINPAPISFTEA